MTLNIETVFRNHQGEVFGYLLRMVGNREAAEDLAQETFFRALRGALRFRGESSVRTWLFQIARNLLADRARRSAPESGRLPDVPVSGDPTDRLAIEETLHAMSMDDREALVLIDVLGFMPREAARVVGLQPNAFRVRLHRARARFKEVYGRD